MVYGVSTKCCRPWTVGTYVLCEKSKILIKEPSIEIARVIPKSDNNSNNPYIKYIILLNGGYASIYIYYICGATRNPLNVEAAVAVKAAAASNQSGN